MAVAFSGHYAIGDSLWFHFSTRDEAGLASASFVPAYYDVIEPSSGAILYGDQTLNVISSYNSDIYVPASAITLSEANGFAAGEHYIIVIKEQIGGATEFTTTGFTIGYATQILGDTSLIVRTEVADSALTGSSGADNTVLGRLLTLERNQYEVIFPRLKRLLGLAGEHQVVDGFLYDDSGNVTSCRVRIFDTKANAAGASLWNDAVNDADPAPSYQTGEIERYTIAVTHLLPRNLRTIYRQAAQTNQGDNNYIDSTDGSVM